MRVVELEYDALCADLAGPMRSRGSHGFTEYFHAGSGQQRLTPLEIITEDGHRGLTLLPGDARRWVSQVAMPALNGADPRSIRHIRRDLTRRSSVSGRGLDAVSRACVNRVEFALWDLAAQSAGLPLFRLLGGRSPQVRLYAGGGSLCWNPLPLLLDEAHALIARGFRAIKVKIGHGPEDDAAIVRAIRGAVGPDVRLMVDANQAYDLVSALRLCDVLEDAGVHWFEEPFGYQAPTEWHELRDCTSVLITGGEGFHHLSQAAAALRDGIVSVLQCDAGGFGLDALLAVASMAEEAGVALTPHSCNTAIGFVIACHLQTALPNAELQEFETFDSPFIHSIFNEPFDVREGEMTLPKTSGLGFTLNRDTVERYKVPD